MYSLKTDWAQKKKKQALRRLSQSGQKGTSPSQSSSGAVRTYVGAVRGRRGGRGGRGRVIVSKGVATRPPKQQAQQQDNPFLAAVSGQGNNSQNPFLSSVQTETTSTSQTSQINQVPPGRVQHASTNPFLSSKGLASATSSSQPPPPSYASAVSAGRVVPTSRPPPAGPIPTFITRGADSVPVLASTDNFSIDSSTTQNLTNPFISASQSNSLPSYNLSSGGSQSGEPKFAIPGNINLGSEPAGVTLGQTSVPLTVNLSSSQFQSSLSSDSAGLVVPAELPSYDQATLLTANQPGLQLQSGQLNSAGGHPSNMTLHVKGVPLELNNEAFMEKHFSRFGPLKAIECNPQKRYATVTFQDKESAIKAKRQGKILSEKYKPVQMFWQSISVDKKPSHPKPTQSSKYVYIPNSQANQASSSTINDAGPSGNLQQQGGDRFEEDGDNDSGLEDGGQTDSIPPREEGFSLPLTAFSQKPVLKSIRHAVKQSGTMPRQVTKIKETRKKLTNEPKMSGRIEMQAPVKKRIWERLGDKTGAETKKRKSKTDDDEEWQPEEEGEGEGQNNEEEEMGGDTAPIKPRELADLGLQTTGDEMDTIARYVEHPYFLRSLTQPGSYPGPPPKTEQTVSRKVPPQQKTVVPQKRMIIEGVDSRLVYDIPNLQLPPPPRPKGTSANDIYESLDARDQDIRKAMVKQTSLTNAKSTIGTCPDMCPEKERYRRQDTHRLSWFEVDFTNYEPRNAKVDHSRAIKEYSGSAADKEEPLPHELRPIGVLTMTMDYLVTMVMDEGRDRPGDWYDFVWNRTRAIRKDITLQHLSTYECVELTEKCARFHILCAYLLCEEDMSDFDPKLNSENLNKCLLSLKEFYRDLRHQKGISCPNEAEFCGYDILLHLTDGNVLNLVEKYSPGVGQQPPVRFAVEVALALDSNNFVRFFKMVKNATFLNACIMHGYFNLVRTHALKTINRAHSVVRKPAPFPLSSVARMLAFPSDTKAGEFCSEFELVVSDKMVEFVRSTLKDPNEAIPKRKAPHLVDSKNTKCLGEVVNGGPLPPPPVHTPYSSFSPGTQLASREPSPYPQAPPPAVTYSTEDIVGSVNDIVREVADSLSKDIIEQSLTELEQIELKERARLSVCLSIVDNVVLETSGEVARQTLLEEDDSQRIIVELTQLFVDRVVEEFACSEACQIIQDTYRECVLEADAKSSAAQFVSHTLLEEGLSDCVKRLAEEALDEARREKMEHLEVLRREFEQRQMLKFWKRWRNVLGVRQHLYKCVAAIPPLPPLVTLPWQLDALLPNEKQRKVESMSVSQNSLAKLLEEKREERERKRKEYQSPLDLPSLLHASVLFSRALETIPSSHLCSPVQHIFWKLTFVYPDQSKLSQRESAIVQWLHYKLQFRPQEKENEAVHSPLSPKEPQLLSLSVTSTTPGGAADSSTAVDWQTKLCLVVNGVSEESLQKKEEGLTREHRGTCAMAIFLPTPKYSHDSTEAHVHGIVANIFKVVEQVVGERCCPEIPLLVISSKEMEEKCLGRWFLINRTLSTCVDDHPSISSIKCLLVDVSDAPSICDSEKQLSWALRDLAASSPPQPNLFHLPIKDFVEQGLLKHFVSPVISDGDARKERCLPSQPPAPIINLYNSVIHHLMDSVTSDELRNLNWPVTELMSSNNFSHGALPPLHWNSTEYLASVQDCLIRLQLPPPPPSLFEHTDWSEQCSQCLNYVRSIKLPTGDVMAIIPLMSSVKFMLHHAADSPELAIPWDQVILVCAEHMLAYLNSDLWVSGFRGDKNKEKTFVIPCEWRDAQARTVLDSAHGSVRKRRRHRSDPPCVEVTTTPPAYGHGPHVSLSVGVSPAMAVTAPGGLCGTEEDELRLKLEATLSKEKALSQSFEAQLQQWLSPSSAEVSPAKRQRSRRSAELENSWSLREEEKEDYDSSISVGGGERSIRQGLKQLRKKIRLAKYLDTKDSIVLYNLVNTSPSASSLT